MNAGSCMLCDVDQADAFFARDACGRTRCDAALADGRWVAAYDGSRTATVPDDLAAAVAGNETAAAYFATLDGRNRYAIFHRGQQAKRPETRAPHIDTFVTMLANGEKIHPLRGVRAQLRAGLPERKASPELMYLMRSYRQTEAGP